MYQKLNALKSSLRRFASQIELRKNRIVGSWTYNHPKEIVILTLIVVIGWQNFSDKLPTIEFNKPLYAYNERGLEVVDCDYKCLTREWVNLRTEEIMKENEASYRLQSRYQALTEANAMITEI